MKKFLRILEYIIYGIATLLIGIIVAAILIAFVELFDVAFLSK